MPEMTQNHSSSSTILVGSVPIDQTILEKSQGADYSGNKLSFHDKRGEVAVFEGITFDQVKGLFNDLRPKWDAVMVTKHGGWWWNDSWKPA